MNYYFLYAILLIFSVLILFFIKKRNVSIPQPKMQHPPSPQNTIIMFDLHDVLFEYDYKSIAKLMLTCPNKLYLIVNMLNPYLLWDIFKLRQQKSIAEQYIIGLPKKYPRLQPYVAIAIKIANSQIPNTKMIRLIKELKEKGYTINIFSNIGKEIFNDLQKKFPNIFAHFTHFILPSEENGYMRKPFQEAFTTLISKNQPNTQIIFVDDKKKNINTANLNNIIGILFKCPCQLRKSLQALGVL